MTWFPALLALGLLVNALRLRARLASLRRVKPADPRESSDGYGLLHAEGAILTGEARRAALGHARRNGLDVLDLVPSDLSVERALDLARSVDVGAYRKDPVALGRGAGFATLVSGDVFERAELRPASLDPGEYGAVTVRLRQYTSAADLVVVPARVRPRGTGGGRRRAWLRGLGVSVAQTVAGSMLVWVLVAIAVAMEPGWGLLALGAYCATPYVVFLTGVPITPYDLHRAALLRPLLTPWSWWRTLTGPRSRWERRRMGQLHKARGWYREQIAEGVERFLEPRREDCPWCGSKSLKPYVTSGDIAQRKPGRFTLERCRDCGHVFQNPRLTLEGLDFYYRDVYDGLGAESSERAFSSQGDFYRKRAGMVKAHVSPPPREWLDVGTGHGHFCRTAQTVLPDTAFDGLDFGAGVEEGKRRGWVRRGFRGLFPDLVDDLAGRYEAVSMHHYLEHTRDPFEELDAAAKVLKPGGHLLIELPDPESPFGRLLGRLWVPWLQPEHLHMIPIGNLKQALIARGLRIVAEERRPAHQRYDMIFAVLILLTAFGPDPDRPWAPGCPRAAARLRRAVALGLVAPLLAGAVVLDKLVIPLLPGCSNAYRVLARKAEG